MNCAYSEESKSKHEGGLLCESATLAMTCNFWELRILGVIEVCTRWRDSCASPHGTVKWNARGYLKGKDMYTRTHALVHSLVTLGLSAHLGLSSFLRDHVPEIIYGAFLPDGKVAVVDKVGTQDVAMGEL